MNIKPYSLCIFSIGLAVATTAILVAIFSREASPGAAYSAPQVSSASLPSSTATITPSVIATVTVGNPSYGVGVNPVTNRVYVTNYSGEHISVIDGLNNTVVATITVDDYSYDVGVNQITNRIYISNFGMRPPQGETGYGSMVWV